MNTHMRRMHERYLLDSSILNQLWSAFEHAVRKGNIAAQQNLAFNAAGMRKLRLSVAYRIKVAGGRLP